MFALDLIENPHPAMLAGAIKARHAATTSTHANAFWQGYAAAMADATGCTLEEVINWVDRHEDT